MAYIYFFRAKEGIKTELLKYAFLGANIIPTVMLLLIQLYWIIAMLGFFDFDIFDVDIDLEGAEAVGPLGALAVFLNIGKVPFALVISLFVLNFWIIAMLMYFLPIEAGGVMNGILLIPGFFASIYITKAEVRPLKLFFRSRESHDDIEHKVLTRRCTLLCEVKGERLGQARVKQKGASVVINVKTLFDEESFEKNEVAFVYSKDKEKDFYYIAKSLSKEEFSFNEMEEF